MLFTILTEKKHLWVTQQIVDRHIQFETCRSGQDLSLYSPKYWDGGSDYMLD